MIYPTRYITGAALALLAMQAVAQTDNATILDRIDEHESRMHTLATRLWDNPALSALRLNYDYTTVGIGATSRRENSAMVTEAGDGADRLAFDASTYIRRGNSTLWGSGGYAAGNRHNVVWNEVADADMLYPYLTADDTGGDMRNETYSFSGGYARDDGRHTLWGVAMGYTAAHHWRSTDPRPRNVTGRLDLSAGIGRNMGGRYVVAAGGSFMKYKQTSDIDFKSELGRATIYHLTGMGTDYVRFRGNGLNTRYDGSRYGANLSLAPRHGNGLTANVSASRLTVETILGDMNNLPMASLWHNALGGTLGWRHNGRRTSWGAEADIDIYRRHGTENIFGDAASANYPQIASVDIFADNAYTLTARGVVEHTTTMGLRLAYEPQVSYAHRCMIYLEPPREWLINSVALSHAVSISAALGRRCHGLLRMEWAICRPVESHFVTEEFFGYKPDAALSADPLMAALRSDFGYASAVSRTCSVRTMVSYALDSRHALQLSADFAMGSYAAANKTYEAAVSAGVVF